MLDHFLDLQITPDPEFTLTQLQRALFAKLHRALVQHKSQSIALAYPDMQALDLGNRLRLLGEETQLEQLMQSGWLKGMRDHLRVSDLAAVPANAPHRSLRRVQAKSNVERLRRRAMKRHGLTYEQAIARIPDSCAEWLRLPFLHLGSTSTGQSSFRLFLRLSAQPIAPVTGSFNAYGLSATATIPWF